MKNDIIETSTILRYSSLLASEILNFFTNIFAKIFFVVRYSIVNLNDDKRKCKLDVLIDDKCFELVIISA